MYNVYVNIISGEYNMIYKINDSVYFKKNKYTFKEQIFLNDNKILVYCFVVAKGRTVECLLQSLYSGFAKKEKDAAINDYLSKKIKALECDYSNLNNNAKEFIEITSYKIGK